ncbi:DUF2254 domain-containing protein [Alienimonas chondri]|uniref:DUF2254 domain-containing protein n=1 Tax=Alienimonas chondri TaxID=2681879 RepID=A0ABX1VCY3_9PLAN|nr:DUF2254 domain-containing protein [Alienimonas chondri]NNJ25564.1 hypothetical protein [Alienimonas chondri]
MTRLIHLWDRFRGSFWFIPGLMMVAAALLAFVLPWTDSRMGDSVAQKSAWLATTVSAGQTTVSTIAGASVTVTGVVFSITMVTLSLTSSQFGPRLIRTFMEDSVTQVTLGAFVGTSVYCLLVLRLIRGLEAGAVVPHVSVLAAVVLAIFDLCILVYFVHHTARAVQPSHIVRDVANSLDESVDRLFPEKIGTAEADVDESHRGAGGRLQGEPYVVKAPKNGYLQGINEQALMDWAIDADVTIELLHRPGDFVSELLPIAHVRPRPTGEDAEADCDRTIQEAVVIGRDRTPRQDVRCTISELAEIAVRALSPGINDPYTATYCVDALGVGLARMAMRDRPSPRRYDDSDALRLLARPVTFEEAMGEAFDPIRQYCGGSLLVNLCLLRSLGRIAACLSAQDDADIVYRQAEMVVRGAEAALPEARDRRRIRLGLTAVREALKAYPAPDDVSFEHAA